MLHCLLNHLLLLWGRSNEYYLLLQTYFAIWHFTFVHSRISYFIMLVNERVSEIGIFKKDCD